MRHTDYWHNIHGSLVTYSDVKSAEAWLVRAAKRLHPSEYAMLITTCVEWILSSDANTTLAANFVEIIAKHTPEHERELRIQFECHLLKQKQLEEDLIRAEKEFIQKEKQRLIEENEERIKLEQERIRLKEERLERERILEEQERIQQEALERERIRLEAERLERERILQEQERIRMEALERERILEEQERIQRERIRLEALNQLHTIFLKRFVESDSIYNQTYTEQLTSTEFKNAKITFVKNWLIANLPASLAKNLPDNDQIAAIASVNGNTQVVARAGSGKTLTLVLRTFFLIRHCGVRPEEILLLAFNRKAALEISKRLLSLLNPAAGEALKAEITRRRKQRSLPGTNHDAAALTAVATRFNVALPHTMTFHALAYAVVHPSETLLYDDRESQSEGLSKSIQTIIDDHLRDDSWYGQIRDVMLTHFKSDWSAITHGGFDKDRSEFIEYRRSLRRLSLDGKQVKSFGEKVIADFLFEQGIPYSYERDYRWNGRNYRPDFTIFDKNKKNGGVILEYFGLTGDDDYDEQAQEKIAFWESKSPEWTLLPLYPHDLPADDIAAGLLTLRDRLHELGIECSPLSEEEIWERIKDRAIDGFTRAMSGFINRCRMLSLSSDELIERIESHTASTPAEAKFIRLAHHFYMAYLESLDQNGEEDFNGLMQRAALAIESGQCTFLRASGSGDLSTLRHLAIDEFQDFSDLFFRLLHAIRTRAPAVQLFCVGDDWQAINGFAGSDLRFFQNFADHIGPSQKIHLPTNYRSASDIVALGNLLMDRQGPPATAHQTAPGTLLVADLDKFDRTAVEINRHNHDLCTPAVLRLVGDALTKNLDVVLLCRRNDVPWPIFDPNVKRKRGLDSYLRLVRSFFPEPLRGRITASTAHGYKGLEKPVVIVLDAIERCYPLIHPNWIFSRVLGETLDKLIAEERRLFYVALTRAAESVFFITQGTHRSPFLKAILGYKNLTDITWANYAPIPDKTSQVTVNLGSQNSTNPPATYAIKDYIKAEGYRWSSARKLWQKAFPLADFTLDRLHTEVWTSHASGVVVTITDDDETEIACLTVKNGIWTTLRDDLTVRIPTSSVTESPEVLIEEEANDLTEDISLPPDFA